MIKGFVDLQVNGYLGVDFSAPGLTLEKVRKVTADLRERGTVAFCPTVITSPRSVYEENLPVLARACSVPDLAPHLLGIHLEGPFISREDGARGAHSAEFTADPEVALFRELRAMAEDRVCLVTLAPELPGAMALIRFIVATGVTVSIGHHLADRVVIGQACDCGVKASTHLGNGIPNLLARHPNPIWDQLDEERLTAMLITDGHHLPDSFIRVVTRLKGAERILVVSDSAPIAGCLAGRYNTLGQEAVLEDSGKLWNPAGNHLVGSSQCLLQCMNHLAGLGVLSEQELWRVGHDNPLALIRRKLDMERLTHLPDLRFVDGRFELGSVG